MTLRSLALPAVLVLTSSLVTHLACAQAPSAEDSDAAAVAARAQYNAGTKAFADQRYAEAALAFEAAADAKPSPVALFTAALSWDRTNAPDRAADDYARALALPGLPADKASQARDRLGVLESMLGALTVAGADGAHVQLDSNSERPVPATLHGAAGVHTLTVRPASGTIEHRSVVLERGKTTSLDLAAAPAAATADAHPPTVATSPPPAPEERPPPAPFDWKKTVGIAATGVGGATLLAGVLLGFEANDAKNAYVAAPAHATYDHASALQTWTDVAFIAGGVFTAGGLALLFWPGPKASEPAKAEVSVVPGGLILKGVY
jgi:tetratricopeptide (TPR) repeat protein